MTHDPRDQAALADRDEREPLSSRAEDNRQGYVVLYNRWRKAIFFGGLALLIMVIAALSVR